MNFRRLKLIVGDKGNRFPHCTTLFIDDEVKVVVDPGAGEQVLQELINNTRVDVVLNTHYHFDHIYLNHLFNKSEIWMNTKEAGCFRDRRELGRRMGMYEVYGAEWVEDWLNRIADPQTPSSPYSPMNRHEWWLSTNRVSREYQPGQELDFGSTKVKVVSAPGHTGGFCYLYFFEQGVVYAADVDLTPFGPWYGGIDGDIDMFINSSRSLLELDARYFITGHENGVLMRDEFESRLEEYLYIIDKRDQQIWQMIGQPATLDELVRQGLIYGEKYLVDPWLYMWSYLMVKKHLERMVRHGKAIKDGEKYIAR